MISDRGARVRGVTCAHSARLSVMREGELIGTEPPSLSVFLSLFFLPPACVTCPSRGLEPAQEGVKVLGGADASNLLIPSGASGESRRERADAEAPGERLALTAQQRGIMARALGSSTDSNVMYGSECAKEDQHNI